MFNVQNGYRFDQIDLTDRIYENVIEIWYSQEGQITTNSAAFISYESLILPSLETLATSSEQNISDRFEATVK